MSASPWRLPPAPTLVLIALGLTACHVENGLTPKPTGETGAPEESSPPPPGDLLADPSSSALVVCGSASQDITLQNAGEGDLTIDDLELEGDGWTLEEVSLPLVLEPGASAVVTLSASAGEATLHVHSDDPDTPDLSVPLSATADAAPSLTILSPTHEEVLESGPVSLEAQVSDDVDDPSSLGVTWTSSLDGVVGEATPDSTGYAITSWDDDRSEGNHDLSASVTDACGNTTSTDVGVCQQGGYEVDELDIDAWHFEGSATWDDSSGWLQLTDAATNQVGSAFQIASPVAAGDVDIEFAFYVSGGSGADGMSLTALDAGSMTTYLGPAGCGLGYGSAGCTSGAGLPGWSIEVDTYDNGMPYDPTAQDHVAFSFDGHADAPVVWAALPEMEDGLWHVMSVNVVAPHVTVAIDSTPYIDQDVTGDFDFDAYIGFTASTGALTNKHLVDSLTVTEYVCE